MNNESRHTVWELSYSLWITEDDTITRLWHLTAPLNYCWNILNLSILIGLCFFKNNTYNVWCIATHTKGELFLPLVNIFQLIPFTASPTSVSPCHPTHWQNVYLPFTPPSKSISSCLPFESFATSPFTSSHFSCLLIRVHPQFPPMPVCPNPWSHVRVPTQFFPLSSPQRKRLLSTAPHRITIW